MRTDSAVQILAVITVVAQNLERIGIVVPLDPQVDGSTTLVFVFVILKHCLSVRRPIVVFMVHT